MAGKRQLTREDWLRVAREVFISTGVEDVKVERLAKKMRVTRGSFYWHFKSHQELLDALLHDWEVRNHLEIAQVRTSWARSEPDLSEVVSIWLNADPTLPSFDMAIRSWARKAKEVAEAVYRIDDAWVSLISELFRRRGFGAEESFVRARVVYFHQVGYHALAIQERLEERLKLAPHYYRALTGEEPGAKLSAVIEQVRAKHATAQEPKRRIPRKSA